MDPIPEPLPHANDLIIVPLRTASPSLLERMEAAGEVALADHKARMARLDALCLAVADAHEERDAILRLVPETQECPAWPPAEALADMFRETPAVELLRRLPMDLDLRPDDHRPLSAWQERATWN